MPDPAFHGFLVQDLEVVDGMDLVFHHLFLPLFVLQAQPAISCRASSPELVVLLTV